MPFFVCVPKNVQMLQNLLTVRNKCGTIEAQTEQKRTQKRNTALVIFCVFCCFGRTIIHETERNVNYFCKKCSLCSQKEQKGGQKWKNS